MSDEKPQSLPELQKYLEAYREEFRSNEKDDIATKCEAILRNQAEAIAEGMVSLAIHCPDERVRFQAQRYVMDNLVFPKTSREGGRGDFEQLLNRIAVNPAETENTNT